MQKAIKRLFRLSSLNMLNSFASTRLKTLLNSILQRDLVTQSQHSSQRSKCQKLTTLSISKMKTVQCQKSSKKPLKSTRTGFSQKLPIEIKRSLSLSNSLQMVVRQRQSIGHMLTKSSRWLLIWNFMNVKSAMLRSTQSLASHRHKDDVFWLKKLRCKKLSRSLTQRKIRLHKRRLRR